MAKELFPDFGLFANMCRRHGPIVKNLLIHVLFWFNTEFKMPKTHNNELQSSLSDGVLFPMLTRPRTPETITPSSRPGLEDSIEEIASQLIQPYTRNEQEWLRKACLSRDNYSRVLTKLPDENSQLEIAGEIVTSTECAHIIPFSMGTWRSDSEYYLKSQIWVTLDRYFPSLHRIGFTQHFINDPRNAMTMDKSLHTLFSKFAIAFEATDQTHEYKIKNYKPNHKDTWILKERDNKVKFVNHDSRYELPDPILLETHAIIARILHATGKIEQVDRLQDKKDSIGVLAADGSTDIAALLSVTSLSVLSSRSINTTPRTRQ